MLMAEVVVVLLLFGRARGGHCLRPADGHAERERIGEIGLIAARRRSLQPPA